MEEGLFACLLTSLSGLRPYVVEPPALSRSRPEMGPLSHLLEFIGLRQSE